MNPENGAEVSFSIMLPALNGRVLTTSSQVSPMCVMQHQQSKNLMQAIAESARVVILGPFCYGAGTGI